MTTLVTADLHLSDNPRDAYRFAFMEALPDLVEEQGARRVLILGDITEEKDRHNARLVNRVVNYVDDLAALVSVYFITGNHDYVSADQPFFQFLKRIDRVRWYNEPTPVRLKRLGKCLFLPHTPDLSDWVNLMFDSYDWFFCHQTFKGADVGHGRKITKGTRPPFTPGSKVISGDVHVPQKLGPVTYVGSPYAVDFGDDCDTRLLVLEEGDVRSVPYKGPQKRSVDVTDVELIRGLESSDVRSGDVLRVRVIMENTDISEWPAIMAEIRSWGNAKGVPVYPQLLTKYRTQSEETKRSRVERRDDKELVESYARENGADEATERHGLKLADIS